MKRFLSLLFVMLFALVLVGCTEPAPENPGEGGEQPGEGGEEPEVTLSQLRISGKSTIQVGQEVTYTATFVPADYPDKSVEWSTSDETAVTIDKATGKATGVKAAEGVYIYVTSTATQIRGQKKVTVRAESTESYPDLDGYNIKIAQAEHALGNYDPFLDTYTQLDKSAKQTAWREIEEAFNCTITVDPYPSHAEWGPSRWSYILQQARDNVSDYDFLTVPDNKIPEFVEGNALLDLSDFYVLYGKDMMDPSWVTSGTYKSKLYSLVTGTNTVYNVLYYNIGLLEALQQYDPTLEEPAQLFLDGKWTYDKFVAYCNQAQKAMETAYGEKGVAGGDAQEYFAISGWDSYYWVGLNSPDGQALADTQTMTINITTENAQAAADVVKTIYTSGVADPTQSVDQGVTSWNEGRALFNTGDLWFVGDDTRWKKTLWGEGTTKYGYCPWPMPNNMLLKDYKVALGGTATWVMPVGRDYSGYGEDVTAENIYYAVILMLQKSQQYYESDPSYDKDIARATVAARYAHSEASRKAYIYMQQLVEDGGGFYDPLCTSDNSVGSLYTNASTLTTIKACVTAYGAKQSVGTWAEATATLVPILQENLRKAFS